MTTDPEPLHGLDLLLGDASMPRDRLRTLITATGSAAEGLFRAGDLRGSLAYWDLAITGWRRYGFPEIDHHFSTFLMGRAQTLDHLDELEAALGAYEEWGRHLDAEGRDDMRPWVDKNISRMRRKIQQRDAGQPYRRHTRGVRPDALAWERNRMAEYLAQLPEIWEENDRREAAKAAARAEEAAEEAELAAWRATADSSVVQEYDQIQAQMREPSRNVYYLDGASEGIGIALRRREDVWAQGEALGRRAQQLRQVQPRRPGLVQRLRYAASGLWRRRSSG